MESSPNVIPGRIADELRRFPPFSMLSAETVRSLAAQVSVRVLVGGDRLWKQGDRPRGQLLFLARGRVEYVLHVDERSELIDVRDVGDLLGLTALITGEPFTIEAQVVEDCLRLLNPLVDTAQLAAIAIEAFHRTGYPRQPPPSLEEVCTYLGASMTDRHTALGDAFTTATLSLLLCARSRRLKGRAPGWADLPGGRL